MSKRLPRCEESKEATPILVYNPYTDKTTNIEPFFRFIQSFNSIEDCRDIVYEAVKSLAKAPLMKDFEDCEHEGRVLHLDFLFELRDTFNDLKECEISSPKKR